MICSLDTLVALIAAFIVIPAVFATGVEPGKGASFAFVSLAQLGDVDVHASCIEVVVVDPD